MCVFLLCLSVCEHMRVLCIHPYKHVFFYIRRLRKDKRCICICARWCFTVSCINDGTSPPEEFSRGLLKQGHFLHNHNVNTCVASINRPPNQSPDNCSTWFFFLIQDPFRVPVLLQRFSVFSNLEPFLDLSLIFLTLTFLGRIQVNGLLQCGLLWMSLFTFLWPNWASALVAGHTQACGCPSLSSSQEVHKTKAPHSWPLAEEDSFQTTPFYLSVYLLLNLLSFIVSKKQHSHQQCFGWDYLDPQMGLSSWVFAGVKSLMKDLQSPGKTFSSSSKR